MDRVPTISREKHSSYCSTQSGAAPVAGVTLQRYGVKQRRLLWISDATDTPQGAQRTRRIGREPTGTRSCFAEYRIEQIINSTYNTANFIMHKKPGQWNVRESSYSNSCLYSDKPSASNWSFGTKRRLAELMQ